MLIGPNGCGKTSLLAPFLLLKQTLASVDKSIPLVTRGELVSTGSFTDIVFRHDDLAEIRFYLGFHRHEPDSAEPLEAPPTYPPGGYLVGFTAVDDPTGLTVSRVEVEDWFGQNLLRRKRRSSGSYSLTTPPDLPKGTSEDDLGRAASTAIRAAQPKHFMFTTDDIVSAVLKKARAIRRESGPIELGEATSLYLTTVDVIAEELQNFVSRTRFLGPLRQEPRRAYELMGIRPEDVGTRGEYAPELVYWGRDTDLIPRINTWLRRFGFDSELSITPLPPDTFSVCLTDQQDNMTVNLADTGFGLSQLLPILVQGTIAETDSVFVVEEPEIHLNPRMQTVLADFFTDMASHSRRVLVETHSEHLLLRLRRLVAEGRLSASDVAIYYVEKDGAVATVREVRLADNGHIEPETWPSGFFEESLNEAMELALAQAGRRAP
jgi:hypothetical protein